MLKLVYFIKKGEQFENMAKNKKTVIVGLSGGVDSSACVYLLKQLDYNVKAMFMRNWDSALNNDILGNKSSLNPICPQEQDYLDATAVAKKLDVELIRVDFVKEYWDYVFNHFIEEYQNARTPNPDILCNKYIKFNYFLNYALEQHQSDYIAMGHYARVIYNEELQEYQLLKGIDKNKDQSYFLCQLTQKQLKYVIFPLGELTKEKVREIAKQQELATAFKKDSTGICFIGERDFKQFLKNYIPSQTGDIIDIETEKVVGNHEGFMYYTIGQRKGLNLGGMEQRYFVVGKNVANKILYVAKTGENNWLYANQCSLINVNWINTIKKTTVDCAVKIRYRSKDVEAKVVFENDEWKVYFAQMVKALTPGQEVVFYQEDVCLGGGTINKIYKNGIQLWYV